MIQDSNESSPNWPSNLKISASSSSSVTLGLAASCKDEPEASQNIEQFGIAGRTWEAAYALREYLTPPPRNPTHFFDPPCPLYATSGKSAPSRTILELGSGTGFVAVAIAPQLLSTDTLFATDLEEVLPLLKTNLAAAVAADASIHGIVEIAPLEWGHAGHLTMLRDRLGDEGIDLILASDVVYFPFLYPSLLTTLLELTNVRGEQEYDPPDVIFAYKTRSLVREQPFWESFGRWFEFTPVLVCHKVPPSSPPATATPLPDLLAPPIAPTSTSTAPHLAESITPDCSLSSWSTFGESSEIYIFHCRRRPNTYDAPIPALEKIMEGDKDDQFERLLFSSLEYDI